MKHKKNVLSSVKEAALSHRLLTAGTILSATGEVLATPSSAASSRPHRR